MYKSDYGKYQFELKLKFERIWEITAPVIRTTAPVGIIIFLYSFKYAFSYNPKSLGLVPLILLSSINVKKEVYLLCSSPIVFR